MNNIYFVIIAIVLMVYIIAIVRKNKLSVKASFWWLVGSVVILLLSIFPYSINWFAEIFGIAYPPALLLTLAIVFLIFVNFQDSCHISDQQAKITELAEQVALLRLEQSRTNSVKTTTQPEPIDKRESHDKKSHK